MMGKRLLAISPTPECLCLAARITARWDEFAIGGAKLVTGLLGQWAEGRPGSSATILVADANDPAALRLALTRFTATGGQVLWFAREDSTAVIKACTGLDQVKLICGPSLREAFESIFLPQPQTPDMEDPDLQDYLRHKITLSFMRIMDPAPLAEAIKVLACWKGRKFDLARAARDDVQSVRHFRETEFPYIEGQSEPVLALKRRIMALGPTPMSVLIIGETGTGKEAVAFYLHEFSPRRAGPFVSINCAGLDEHYLRSELFGHKKGSFTGAIADRRGLVEQAGGGTIFFDELGDMPLSVQADLLRFMQTRRFRPLGSDEERTADVRLVAAAQPSICNKMTEGEFRIDLYYRIAEAELITPRLADVPEDIIRIVRHMVYRCRAQDGVEAKIRSVIEYFHQGQAVLQGHHWPGNVRELARYVRRRLFIGDDVLPEIARLHPSAANGRYPAFQPVRGLGDIDPLEELGRKYVRHVWEQRGAITQQDLAAKLQISINTLKKYLAAPVEEKGGTQP